MRVITFRARVFGALVSLLTRACRGARILRHAASLSVAVALCVGAFGLPVHAAFEGFCPPAFSVDVAGDDDQDKPAPDAKGHVCHCHCVSFSLPQPAAAVDISASPAAIPFGARLSVHGVTRAPAGPPPKSPT